MQKLKKVIATLISFVFILQQASFAQVALELNIGKYLNTMPSPAVDVFRPIHMRYFFYEPSNESFKVLLDKGDFEKNNLGRGERPFAPTDIKDTAKTLLKYFLIGVTLPNDKFWVNLRPDASDQIIDPELAKTDVGKILLEADLQLKKDTARFTSPQTPEGKEYWDKLYKKAGELLGSDSIEIPTLTRPWIVPGEVIIRQTSNSAYVYKAGLKVMLEEDYLRHSEAAERPKNPAFRSFVALRAPQDDERLKELNKYSTELIKELILPKITQEVNTAKRYAEFRQVFYSLVLAQWFKKAYAGRGERPFAPTDFINRIDTQNLTGLTSKTSWSKETYFQEYQKSFKNGEYKLNETVSTLQGRVIRSYFSGGIVPIVSPANLDEFKGGLANPASAVLSFGGAVGLTGAVATPDEVVLKSTTPEGLREPEVTATKSTSSPVSARNRRTPEKIKADREALKVLLDKGEYTRGELAKMTGIPIIDVQNDTYLTLELKDHPNLLIRKRNKQDSDSAVIRENRKGAFSNMRMDEKIEMSIRRIEHMLNVQGKSLNADIIYKAHTAANFLAKQGSAAIEAIPVLIRAAQYRQIDGLINVPIRGRFAEVLIVITQSDHNVEECLAGLLLDDPNESVRESAARCIVYGDLRVPAFSVKTIDALKRGAQEQDSAISEPCQRALKKLKVDFSQLQRVPVIGGNWKMAIEKEEDAVALLEQLARQISTRSGIETFIAPSSLHIPAVSVMLKSLEKAGIVSKGAIKIAAQNMYAEDAGAFTGGLSAAQLKQYGVTHVILGYSEVRRNKSQMPTGESSANVNRKVKAAFKYGLIPIVCVGESGQERGAHQERNVVGSMVAESLTGLSKEGAARVIIAYEPVWAIGTGKSATPEQAEEMHRFIRGVITTMFDSSTAAKIRILYGGSVTADNPASFRAQPDIDGALVGGASLKADSFNNIIKLVVATKQAEVSQDDLLVAEYPLVDPDIARLLDFGVNSTTIDLLIRYYKREILEQELLEQLPDIFNTRSSPAFNIISALNRFGVDTNMQYREGSIQALLRLKGILERFEDSCARYLLMKDGVNSEDVDGALRKVTEENIHSGVTPSKYYRVWHVAAGSFRVNYGEQSGGFLFFLDRVANKIREADKTPKAIIPFVSFLGAVKKVMQRPLAMIEKYDIRWASGDKLIPPDIKEVSITKIVIDGDGGYILTNGGATRFGIQKVTKEDQDYYMIQGGGIREDKAELNASSPVAVNEEIDGWVRTIEQAVYSRDKEFNLEIVQMALRSADSLQKAGKAAIGAIPVLIQSAQDRRFDSWGLHSRSYFLEAMTTIKPSGEEVQECLANLLMTDPSEYVRSQAARSLAFGLTMPFTAGTIRAFEKGAKELNSYIANPCIKALEKVRQNTSSPVETPGGIDLRNLAPTLELTGGFKDVSLIMPPITDLPGFNLSEEQASLKNMLNGKIYLTGQRLSEYLAASYQKGELNSRRPETVFFIAQTCKISEERGFEVGTDLKQAMLLADALPN